VVADLVVNHTSAQHPWFQAARTSKDNPYRGYYVWRSDSPPDTSDKVVFPDKEDSIWEFDEGTGAWYLHHFYSHQPDLNFANPAVRDHIAKAMGLWLRLGLAGFRVDAVPFLIADVDTAGDDVPGHPHEYLKALRSFLGRRRGDAILLSEVNLPHKEQQAYFGGSDGDELTMMFDFIGMEAMYLSLASEDARPVAKALTARPPIHPDCQWATFARNHDELILDKRLGRGTSGRLRHLRARTCHADLRSRSEAAAADHGRRRFPPDPDGLQPALQPPRHTHALLRRRDRDGRGTPSGGSTGGPYPDAVGGHLQRRVLLSPSPPSEPTAGARRLRPEHVNVAAQKRDPDSLWTFVRTLIQTYRECPELGWGDFRVLAHRLRTTLTS
jgi:glycosidase